MKLKLCFKLIFTFFISLLCQQGFGQSLIFSENMGTGTSTQAQIPNYGFQNPGMLSGNFTIVTSLPSSGYTGSSGSSNAFLNGNSTNLLITGINTSDYTNIILSFGQKKGSNNEANSTNFKVEVSVDGNQWNVLNYTNTGNTDWRLVTISNNIPSTSNLRIKFTNLTTQQWRLDDIKLIGTLVPQTAPILTTPQTITGTYGVLINQTITGEHITPSTNWFITGTKPTGVNFANGIFNGIPTVIGTFTSNVKAKNGDLESNEATINFNIAKANQTFELPTIPTKYVDDANVSLPSKTKNESNNTLEANDITYTSNDPSVVAIVNGNQLDFLSEGTATITASVNNTAENYNHNYLDLESTSFTVNVIKKDQTVNLMDLYELVINENIQLPINSEQGILLNYTLSNNNGVVEIIGNQLKALAEGEVTLVVSNNGNNIYKDFYKEILIKVSLFDVNNLMISQIYSAGGGSGATYKNDFVELYNSSDVTIPLFGLHLQYASSNGLFNVSSNTSYDLTLSFKENDYIEPKSFYLIKLGGGSTGSDLNYFENTANINIATTDGKLALTKRLLDNHTGQDRSDIIDLVGYGNANIYEGSGKANSPTNTKSIRRKNNGTQDTNDNKNDFDLIDVNPYVNISVWENRNWFKGVLPNENRNAVLLSDLLNTTTFTAKNVLVYKNVTVPSGVVITSVESLKIKDGLTLTFNEGAYLIQQKDNALNKGNATFKRNAAFYGFDSKFWSSPVSQQSISNFMTDPSAVYQYNESGRNWLATSDDNFEIGKGYAFQVGRNYPFMGQGDETSFTGLFTGVPNNGVITFQAQKSTNGLGDNGVGNPYGSPISTTAFLEENDHVTRLYFWNEEAHYDPTVTPVGYNKQTWFALNKTGSNNGPGKLIGVGVGFIARVNSNDDVIFKNSMRNIEETDDNIFNRNNEEVDRFWLSLNSDNNKNNQILIGYVEGATNGIDEKYDARNISNNNSFILSHSNANAMIIEGRQYPLDINDQIPLYFRASKAGEYTIKLENKEGVFNSQPIYLVDNILDLSINLNEVSAYTFDTTIGDFPTRFEIRYQPKETLNLSDLNDSINLVVYKNEGLNKVTSKENVTGYKVYDYSGQLVASEKVNHLNNFVLTTIDKGTYIIKFSLENGSIINKKVIY